MLVKFKNRPFCFEADKGALIPKIRGNTFTIHKEGDKDLSFPLLIIKFAESEDLRKFFKKINCLANLSHYTGDISSNSHISIR